MYHTYIYTFIYIYILYRCIIDVSYALCIFMYINLSSFHVYCFSV